MTFEAHTRDWSEINEWLSLNTPQATWSHTWCEYSHPETGAWTEIVLFNIMNVSDDELLLFRISMSHVLRGNSSKDDSQPEMA